MNFETFKILQEAFSEEEKSHSKKRSFYQKDVMEVATAIESFVSLSKTTGSIIDVIRYITEKVDNTLKQDFAREGVRTIPWMSPARVKKILERDYSSPMQISLESLIAAYIYQIRVAIAGRPSNTEIDDELASYTSWQHIDETLRLGRETEAYRANFTAMLDQQKSDWNSHLVNVTESVNTLQKSAHDATSIVNSARAQFKEAIESIKQPVEEAEQRAGVIRSELSASEARLLALQEGLATMSAKMLWDARAKSGALSFWLSAGLLAIMLLAAPALALYHLDDVIRFLRHVNEALAQNLPVAGTSDPKSANEQNGVTGIGEMYLAITALSRLILITLPIALYLWVIRLIVRFNSRSLVLMDDAQQRHTMMDTYFHLIERETAAKEDRALILAALFRPMPGQGNDNVDPPNFTELLQRGIAK